MYRLECIKDGAVTQTIELDSVQVIPPDGHLIVTVPTDVDSADLVLIREELRHFFDNGCNFAVVRAGDVQFTHFATVSTEGAAWASEATCPTCRGVGVIPCAGCAGKPDTKTWEGCAGCKGARVITCPRCKGRTLC